MAATTQDLLDAMADQIDSAIGSGAYGVQIHPFHVADASPPTVDMYPGDVSRGTEAAAFNGDGEFLFTVRIRVPGNDVEANMRLLNAFMDDVDPLSVPQALMDDTTLGGIAASMDCVDPTGLVLYPYGGEVLPGRQFTCKVIRADS